MGMDVLMAPPSEFGFVAARIDIAERIGGERIGGASRQDVEAVRAWERRLTRLQPSTLVDWQWLAQRLARAVENGWSRDDALGLARLAD